MINMCHQVFMTYFRRKFFLALLAAIALWAGVFVVGAKWGAGVIWPIMVLAICLYGNAFAAFLGLHLKEQFANPRSKCTPNFNVPHLVGAGLFLAMGIIAAAVGIKVVTEFSMLASMALATIVFAFGCGWGYCPAYWILLLQSLPVVALLSSEFQLFALACLEDNVIMSAVWVAGCVLLSFIGYRAVKLTEEHPEYHLKLIPEKNTRYRLRDQTPWFTRNSMMPGREIGISLWDRTRHWQIVLGRQTPFIHIVAMALVYCLVMELMFRAQAGAHGFLQPGLGLMLCWVSFFGAVRMLTFFRQVMGYEFLKPVGRSRYMLEIGATIFIAVIKIYLPLFLGTFLAVLILNPALLHDPSMQRAMIVSVPAQLLGFGLAALVMAYATSFASRFILCFLTLGIVTGVGIGIGLLVWSSSASWGTFIGFCTGVLFLGLLSMRFAYYRWGVVELG